LSGLEAAQFLYKKWRKCFTPFAKSFVAGFGVLVMQYFLNVSILEGKVMPKSDRVLDVGRQETTRRPFWSKRGISGA